MEDDNEIIIEDDIVKNTRFNGGIYGTTSVLVYAENIFGKRAVKKKNQKLELEQVKHMNYVGGNIQWR